MNTQKLLVGVLVEKTSTYDPTEVCQKLNIPQELLIEMIEQGLFHTQVTDLKDLSLDHKSIQDIECALRLHKDLGLNLPGAVLAIELLDEIKTMRQELEVLRRHYFYTPKFSS